MYVSLRETWYLLPIQEALQDQQVCLTQAPFKSRLCAGSLSVWDLNALEEQRLCVLHLWHYPLCKPCCLQSPASWELIFLVQDPWAGERNVGACSLGWITAVVVIILFVGRPFGGVVLITLHLCLPTTSPLPSSFCVSFSSGGYSFLLVFRTFSVGILRCPWEGVRSASSSCMISATILHPG